MARATGDAATEEELKAVRRASGRGGGGFFARRAGLQVSIGFQWPVASGQWPVGSGRGRASAPVTCPRPDDFQEPKSAPAAKVEQGFLFEQRLEPEQPPLAPCQIATRGEELCLAQQVFKRTVRLSQNRSTCSPNIGYLTV